MFGWFREFRAVPGQTHTSTRFVFIRLSGSSADFNYSSLSTLNTTIEGPESVLLLLVIDRDQ